MNEVAPSARVAVEQAVVLVVDDEPDLLELVGLTLSRMSLKTRTASDLQSARRLLKAERFDLCLTDVRLPDGDGLDLVAWIQENKASVPVAVITAHGNIESAVRALKLGAFDFVSKPLDLGVLRKLVGSAIRLRAGADERTAASLQGARLLGSSTVMEQLRDMIARVARSQAPVHIYGESGTDRKSTRLKLQSPDHLVCRLLLEGQRASARQPLSLHDALPICVLRKLVGSAIRLRAGADERTAASLQGARLLGSSTVMEQLRDMIARVARSQAPVHIYGESG